MTNQEVADELQYAIDLIKQDGKDWLDERDIPILEAAISALQAQDEEQREEPLYCDRDICLRNDYNGIGCGDCEVTKSQQQAKHGDGLDEAIWRLENISEYQSAEAERWDHSFDDYSGVKRDEYLKWSDEHRQLASWLRELKRLRTEVYFLKAERENTPVDLFGDLPCKTCRWEAETTEKCEECIDGITDNYEVRIECEDCVSRKAAIDATWEEPSYTDPINVLTEVRDKIKRLPSAQPNLQPTCNQLATDCISRQAAIDAVSKYKKEHGYAYYDCACEIEKDIKQLPSAQPEPLVKKSRTLVKDLVKEPCEDAVSRDSVKFLLCKETCHPGAFCPDGFCREICEKVDALPSATQKQRMVEWIPVSERLPEEDHWLGGSGKQFSDNVLISITNHEDEDAWSDISQTIDGEWRFELPRHCKITAWMPLPEPYRAERRTDE